MFKFLLTMALVLTGCGSPTTPTTVQPPSPPPGPKPPADATEMYLHNGNILHSPNVEAVFWGSSWGSNADMQASAEQLLNALDQSSYLGIVTEYSDGYGAATNSLTYAGHTFMNGPSHSLAPDGSDSEFYNALCAAPAINYNPNQNTIYVVFADTPPGVDSNGKLTDCAWHTSFYCYYNGGAKHWATVAYIPNLENVASCNPGDKTSGHSVAAAAMANVTAHELMETITDPWGTGWYDEEDTTLCKSGTNCEIGDKCAWSFNGLTTLTDGSQWKLQMEWSNKAYEAKSGKQNMIQQPGCVLQ